MTALEEFDRTVGRIAGAIYSDITHEFPHPPLMLVPALTFKVRKVVEQITDLRMLSGEQRSALAKEIQIAIVPMLFSYEVDPDVIEEVAPVIEAAAHRALDEAA